jgi:hypothetical protein
MASRSSRDPRDRSNPGLAEARRLLRLPRRKPTDADRPPVSPAPGRKINPLPGQLDLDGNEA